ncbi:MAG TPA: hypothetical protein VKR58_15595 [Aquella sp.]|nr:hypothetical protein [Aquella sp.]
MNSGIHSKIIKIIAIIIGVSCIGKYADADSITICTRWDNRINANLPITPMFSDQWWFKHINYVKQNYFDDVKARVEYLKNGNWTLAGEITLPAPSSDQDNCQNFYLKDIGLEVLAEAEEVRIMKGDLTLVSLSFKGHRYVSFCKIHIDWAVSGSASAYGEKPDSEEELFKTSPSMINPECPYQ